MNNLVFNTTANQLKTAIYAEAPDTSLQPIKIDASQNLLAAVSGTVTVSEITNAVTIGNTSLTVAGTVTVAEVTNPITIGNTSLTVAGTVTVAEVTNPITIGNTSLTVAGTVTVAEVTNPITIGNTSLTIDGNVTISNATLTVVSTNSFTPGTLAETSITGTGVLFADTDVSTVTTKSIFLYNGGTNTITLSLQYSPTTTDGDYIDDPAYTNATIASGESLFIAATNFAHYMRIQYNMGATSETISGYYNLQG